MPRRPPRLPPMVAEFDDDEREAVLVVNRAFYRAFSERDADLMDRIWAPSGAYLWLNLLLFAGVLGVEVLDVLCEEASRRELGGLLRSEYLMHFLMSGAHVAWVLPLLCAPPPAAWALRETALQLRPLWMLLVGVCIAGPAVLIAALHVVLGLRGGAR